MSTNWTAPYYSAASNLTLNSNFLVCSDDIRQFNNLEDVHAEHSYKFSGCNDENLTYYNHNPISFAYLIKFATVLFPFLGSENALILLQYFVFVLLTVLVFRNTEIDAKFKYIFLFVIACNPFILKFVIFNFYYFWQIVPSFLVLYCLLKVRLSRYFLIPLILVSGLVFSFRPTIILIIIIYFYFVYKHESKLIFSLYLSIFLLPILITTKSNDKNFYHTSYIGIGAYDNPWGINLSDEDGYKLYYEQTGEVLNPSYGGNYYEKSTIEKYERISKEYFLKYIVQEPLIFVRNAFLNTVQGFSLGYYNNPVLIFVSVFFGLIHIILLLWKKQWLILCVILCSVGTLAPYYPPIPAYVFGNYLFLAFSWYSLGMSYSKYLRI